MTRINLVHPSELADQHLFAEFREIKMVPKALARALRGSTPADIVRRVPPAFTLGTGHVTFFYNKGAYLTDRYFQLRQELMARGVDFNRAAEFDPEDTYFNNPSLLGQYVPTDEALALIRARLAERIAQKPHWYKYKGMPAYV